MRAQVRIELKTKDEEIIAVRRAKNAVMKAGAELVAHLFAGDGTAITHMGVGISDSPEDDTFSTTGLSNDGSSGFEPLAGDVAAPIPADAFNIEVDEVQRLIRVRLRGTLPDAAAVGTVREAGLLSSTGDGQILYNRVTFAPINKGDDHELTMFWEVTFPYGDLHWLS